MDCSPPGSSIHGVLQARILEWVAIPFTRGLRDPGIKPESPALQANSSLFEPNREFKGFPCSSVGKESACNAGEPGSIPGLGVFLPEESSCLKNPMDRGAWCATIHGVTRIGPNLATKPPPPPGSLKIFFLCGYFLPCYEFSNMRGVGVTEEEDT